MIDYLEPIKLYESSLKEKYKEKVTSYFLDLINVSNIDESANKKTIDEYKQTINELNQSLKHLKKNQTLKIFLIISICLFSFISFILFFSNIRLYISIIIAINVLLIDIGLIILISKVINKNILKLKTINESLNIQIDKLKKLGYSQLKPLNDLYDYNIPAKLINSLDSIIKMDNNFLVSRYFDLIKYFDYKEKNSNDVSTISVQSGTILNNPFFISKELNSKIVNHTYTGSITIHWTERVRTKDGYRTVHRSQVLTASVVKPKPIYYHQTYLLYGNSAAEKLTFSRNSVVSLEDDQKDLDKLVKKQNKRLDKKAKKELMDNDPTTNYQRFGNDEFEVLFGGEDRNDELQYRLLFTPLAQKNLLHLIKSDYPYGDDFSFIKDKKINIIKSRHSQAFDYNANPNMFIDFDLESAKERFINYNVNYFQSLFYDLAPIISIPMYQQNDIIIYEDGISNMNVSLKECEVIANSYDINYLKHPDSDTDVILKANLIKKENNTDVVLINAYSYQSIRHTSLIPKLGGDGRIHNVPVVWYEYIPLVKENKMLIKELSLSRLDYINLSSTDTFKKIMSTISYNNQYVFQRDLFSCLVDKEDCEIFENIINNVKIKESRNEKILKEILKKIENNDLIKN